MATTRGRGIHSFRRLFGRRMVDGSGSVALMTQIVKLLVQRRPTVAGSAGTCTGGGTVASSTDPSLGTSLAESSTPIAFMDFVTDGGTERYSTIPVATGSTFYAPRVLRWGAIRRALSDWFGGFDVATFEVELDDTDRHLRDLASSGTLLKKRVDVYLSDLATITAGGTPRRVFSGVVVKHKPLSGLRYQLSCEDRLGSILSQFFAGKRSVPQRTFTLEDFPNLANPVDHPNNPGNPSIIGKPVPLCYGSLSDEADASESVGVVQCIPVGQRLIPTYGSEWDEFVVCGHAVKSIHSFWIPSGPGLSAGPEYAARTKILTADAVPVEFLVPGMPAYTTAIGQPYRDINGRRYTTIYGFGPRSELARRGTVPLVVNLCGVESVGDGSGTMIDSIALQVQHFLTNFVLSTYDSGNWASIPTMNGYSMLKSSTFAACKSASEARLGGGYLGAWMLAHDLSTVGLHDWLADLCRSGDLDLGINWDGQIVGSMVDASAAAAATWTDVLTVLQDGLELERQFNLAANKVTYRYERRYITPLTNPTPAEDEYLPTGIRPEQRDWYSEGEDEDTDSIAALEETKTYDVEYGALRDAATTEDVTAKRLARSAQNDEGPLMGTVRTGLEGLDVTLGDNVALTHFGGLGATGYTDKRLRIREQELDLNDMVVTHTVQDVAA